MTVYVALLRGINVGGSGKLPMKEFKAACEAVGLTRVVHAAHPCRGIVARDDERRVGMPAAVLGLTGLFNYAFAPAAEQKGGVALLLLRRGVALLRNLVVAIVIVVAAFVLATYLGWYTATFECSGLMSKTPITLFMKTRETACWMFWDTALLRGALALEIPSTTGSFRTDYFLFERDGLYLNVIRDPNDLTVDWKKLGQRGQFSLISNALILNISDQETFRGTCTPKNN